MTEPLSLDVANRIVAAALERGSALGAKPLTVAVLDAGGHLKALARSDGASTLRPQLAIGKAHGAIALGMGSRALMNRAEQQPYFVQALNGLAAGSLVPVPGGVLVRDGASRIVGAVGITGDTSDTDEACAVAAIESVGLVADAG